MANAQKLLQLRVPPALWDRIATAAARAGQSINALAIAWLEAGERASPPPPQTQRYLQKL